jgi:alcohol dehydrogenase class IV
LIYHNPVEVIETNKWKDQCDFSLQKLGICEPLVITTNGTVKRQNLLEFFNNKFIFSDISPNPTIDSCQEAINYSLDQNFDGIIALGGGSTLDTAKVVMASLASGISDINKLIKFKDSYMNKVKSIFIPTTHGTGGEVTRWGTIWNLGIKKKYSISHPDLYPDIAILDGNLSTTLPIDISIITCLDALSHSFEAIWNKNANLTSTDYAIESICLILSNINRLVKEPNNIRVRNILLKASNIAGLAFSNTKTAAAHSISYPLTINFNIPHGIASSMPLLHLLHINKIEIENELRRIQNKMGFNDLNTLTKYIRNIPNNKIKYSLREWGVLPNELESLVDQSFTKGRMDNNIVDLSKDNVLKILEGIY